jgi:hypothetical protein
MSPQVFRRESLWILWPGQLLHSAEAEKHGGFSIASAYITIPGCSTKELQSFPRVFHVPMCQFNAPYDQLLSLGILSSYGNIMPYII